MLFDATNAVGFFLGLSENGLSFGAELNLNYNATYQSEPMLGRFLLIELERNDEAVLGRITAISSHGKLASSAGEELGARSVEHKRPLAEDIKKDFLRYRCAVKLLGMLRECSSKIIFTPSHRRLPHLGAKVVFADGDVLQAVAGGRRKGAEIGFLAFGEFIYASGHPTAASYSSEFVMKAPVVIPRFDVEYMVARRTAVFARSGFGKSNLLKMLFAKLYEGAPTIPMHDGTHRPVGTLVFDPDGDYFWPGSGKDSPPGLCDIPQLKDSIVVFTSRTHENSYYNGFKVCEPRLDLRDLLPSLVLPCYLNAERMKHRGTEAMLRMKPERWAKLVNAAWLDLQGVTSLTVEFIKALFNIRSATADAMAYGIRSTMLDLVSRLHSPSSVLIPAIKDSLARGKLVVVDLSMMRGASGTALSAIILRYLFDHNIREHTKEKGEWLPVIALIEEAQSVLNPTVTGNGPFIEWVKEGRKYHLGAVLVTQQPGAIDTEIISQVDNFFVFHLISGHDLHALSKANGHFTEDILASLLNEPIQGQGVFWSSSGERMTYPIPFRAFNFGDIYKRLESPSLDPNDSPFAWVLANSIPKPSVPTKSEMMTIPVSKKYKIPNAGDITKSHRECAQKVKDEPEFNKNTVVFFRLRDIVRDKGGAKKKIEDTVCAVLTEINGLYGYGWKIEPRENKDKSGVYDWVVLLNREDGLARLQEGEMPLIEKVEEEDEEWSGEVE